MKYSRAEIQAMAVLAGWGTRARDASYVAMAESSGDAGIVNSIGAVGLMQVNQPVHVKAHPTWTVAWLKNPVNNLRAAKVLFDEAGRWDGPWLDSRDKGGLPTGNGGWGQYVKGSGATQVSDPCDGITGDARDYCEKGQNGGGGGSTAPPSDPDAYGDPYSADLFGTGGLVYQLGRLAQVVTKGANWMSDPGNWVRVVYVVGGGVLAIAAVNVVARPVVAPAVQAVQQVTPTRTYRRVRRGLATRRANIEASKQETQ